LTERIAALNRLISRSIDKCLPFFKILRKAFTLSEECEEAFGKLKEYLMNPPLLSRPTEGEILYLYLVVSPSAVSLALVREDARIQKLVYFTSKAFHGAEERYLQIEKLAFALVVSARRLRPYFQAHTIRVLTKYPMGKVLQKPDLSGRLVSWAKELGQFDIEFHPRTAIKGQVLADFLVEFYSILKAEELPKELTWIVHVDGSSARSRSGVGVILRNPKGQEFGFAIKLDFVTTNNKAEYEAVISGLALSQEMGATNVEIRSDSQVVVGQVQEQFDTQQDRMARYLDQVRKFQSYFDRVVVTKIPREANTRVVELSKIAAATDEEIEASRWQIIVLIEPSITPKVNIMQADTAPTEPKSATKIIQFLKNVSLPQDKAAARKIKNQATRYSLLGEVLYKRGYSEPLLKCLSKTEAEYVLKEIHEGMCGNHSGGRMLAEKTIRAGYYWHSISKDSARVVKHCDKCQRFSRIMKTTPEKLTPITSP
jgi:ribonuclease HI